MIADATSKLSVTVFCLLFISILTASKQIALVTMESSKWN